MSTFRSSTAVTSSAAATPTMTRYDLVPAAACKHLFSSGVPMHGYTVYCIPTPPPPPPPPPFALSPWPSALLTMRRMEGGVCFTFGADNQFNMFFTKQLGGMHSNHWMT